LTLLTFGCPSYYSIRTNSRTIRSQV